MQPVHTTKSAAQALLKQAYAEGRLAAQASEALSAYYLERLVEGEKKFYYCAIGIVLGEKNAKALEMGNDYILVEELIETKNLIVPEEDKDWFLNIQSCHDVWAFEESAEKERLFLQQLEEA